MRNKTWEQLLFPEVLLLGERKLGQQLDGQVVLKENILDLCDTEV